MREFKFRVWDQDLKRWLINLTLESTVWFSWEVPIDSRGNVIWQQYTGYIDKNKKEIYEGDIVKSDESHMVYLLNARRFSEHGAPVYDKGIVKWLNAGFNVCQAHIGRMILEEFSMCHCCPCALEIIGNNMENPELVV